MVKYGNLFDHYCNKNKPSALMCDEVKVVNLSFCRSVQAFN